MSTPFRAAMPALTPTGTARAQFQGPGADAAGEVLSHDLRESLRARDVPDATVLAGWEVARWGAGAPPSERRALFLLVVALLEAMDRGGTFVRLISPALLGAEAVARGEPGSLSAALASMGVGERDRRAVGELTSRLVEGKQAGPIAALFGAGGARRPFVIAEGALYTERLWSAEANLVARLRERLAGHVPAIPSAIDKALAAVATTPGAPPLADEQVAAVRAAIVQPFTVIAGGPGSGKTTLIVALLRTLARLQVPMGAVALAAPTGRAAQRITESIAAARGRPEEEGDAQDQTWSASFEGAVTLHRLLGIRPAPPRLLEPEAPEYYQAWPLPHKFVIVDEASMIDLVLMEQLVSAAAPDARLILLGDPEQLPSVQVGAVLRDLVAGAPRYVRRLARSHRMNPENPAAAEILRVANGLHAGMHLAAGAGQGDAQAPHGTAIAMRTRASALSFSGFEQLTAGALPELIQRWHEDVLGGDTHLGPALDRPRATPAAAAIDTDIDLDTDVDTDTDMRMDRGLAQTLLTRHASARILCLTRSAGRATSADAVNGMLHARMQAAAVSRGAGARWSTAAFVPGEPVIILRNDYARQLSNGDLGVIVRVARPRGDALAVAFARQNGVVIHPLEELENELALAFALTVHKAQGSEYDRVAVILPDVDVALLSREILYTALTRARHGVVVVGDPALFALGASRTLDRTSAIADHLGGP